MVWNIQIQILLFDLLPVDTIDAFEAIAQGILDDQAQYVPGFVKFIAKRRRPKN